MADFRFSILTSARPLGGRAEAIRTIAAIGYDGIELDAPRPDEDLGVIVRELEAARLPAVNIGTVQGLMPIERTSQEIRDTFRPSARLARLSGAGQMQYCCAERPAPGETLDHFRDRLVERLSLVADLAAEEGVVFCYEALAPDSGVVGVSTAEGCEIVSRVNKPSLRMTFDTYHSAAAGEDPVAALQLVLPWLSHVHLSDIRHTSAGLQRPLPGKGEIDFSRFVRALADTGYSRYVGMEGGFETNDIVGELKQCLAYLRQL